MYSALALLIVCILILGFIFYSTRAKENLISEREIMSIKDGLNASNGNGYEKTMSMLKNIEDTSHIADITTDNSDS